LLDDSTEPTKTSRFPTIEDEILLDFGKNAIRESVTTIKDYVNIMVPLTTALITAYLALLKLLGLEQIPNLVTGQYLIIPPVLTLISLSLFIIALFPVPMKLSVGDDVSIRSYRRHLLSWKFGWTLGGTVFFVSSVTFMIFAFFHR